MTEGEWLAATEPWRMLLFVQAKTDARRLRLFAAACCRRVWTRLSDARSRAAVELAERAAEEAVEESVLAAAREAAWAARTTSSPAAWAAWDCLADDAFRAAVDASRHAAWATPDSPRQQELEGQAAVLRDLVTNPFSPRPEVRSEWLRWRAGYVPQLARGICDDRVFQWVPVLADALEDAGCSDAELLGHLRAPGPHVRGCWALDLILSRE
jgi:hypothetical protein